MKKWIRSVSQAAVLGMALGTYTQIAYADSGTPSRVSGEVKPPVTLVELEKAHNIFEAIFLRLHTVNIQNHISEMKRDGVTTREYVAAFDLQGTLVYDHELAGLGLRPENLRAGRNVGVQVLPYEVQLGMDGRTYIKATAVALRNMTSAGLNCDEYAKKHFYCEFSGREYDVDESEADGTQIFDGFGGVHGSNGFEGVERTYKNKYEQIGIFRVLNNVDILTFEYDKDVVRDIKTFTVDFVKTDLNISLFATASGNFFAALSAGGALGYESMEIKDLFASEHFYIEESDFVAKGNYGLLAHFENGTWRLNAGVNFTSSFKRYFYKDERERNNEYHMDRIQHIARPYLETSVQLQSSEDGLPIRAGLRVDGNINIKDKIQGDNIQKDLTQRGNQSMFNGSLFISW